ncbi:MAG: DEAD/DEAH box helicase [Spirochaetota bacterium]
MKFSELPLEPQTRTGIEAAAFEDCMPVQEKVFEQTLKGGDVLVQSQTGTGKTAAFLITILERFAKAADKKGMKALVIVPTRELAVQIEHDATLLAKGFPELEIGTFYGGIGYKEQDEQLNKGVNLYIGTPGRLMDYSKARKIPLEKMDVVVVDEADRLFDMGFYPDIQYMFQRMKSRDARQTLLFSATLSNRARNLAWEFMNEPVEIDIESESITVNEIRQELYHVSKQEKFSILLRLLADKQPENAIIFTNTKSMAVEVAKRLEINGYGAQVLMGDVPQSKRLKVIDGMKRGSIKFLVATDVAARGLHVEGLQLVVNYDVPEDFENYVHRVGRTARAGNSGLAITLACEQFVYGLEAVEEYIQMKIPVVQIDDEILPKVTDKSAHLRFHDLVNTSRQGGSSGKRSFSPKNTQRGASQSRDGKSRQQSRQKGSSQQKGGSKQGGSAQANDKRRKNSSEKAPRVSENRPTSNGEKPSQAPSGQKKQGSPRHTDASGNDKKRSNTQRQRPQKPQPKKGGESIEHLSFEQRVAYYKKKYGGGLETESKEGAGDNSRNRKHKPGKDASGTQSPNKPSESQDSGQKTSEQPETGGKKKKKPDFLSKLLKRKE